LPNRANSILKINNLQTRSVENTTFKQLVAVFFFSERAGIYKFTLRSSAFIENVVEQTTRAYLPPLDIFNIPVRQYMAYYHRDTPTSEVFLWRLSAWLR